MCVIGHASSPRATARALLQAAATAPAIEITDASGKVVRRLPRLSNVAGVNRVAWDLRGEGAAAAPAGGGRRRGGGGGAAAVLPGTYTVTLRVNGTTHTKTVQVRNDPRS